MQNIQTINTTFVRYSDYGESLFILVTANGDSDSDHVLNAVIMSILITFEIIIIFTYIKPD